MLKSENVVPKRHKTFASALQLGIGILEQQGLAHQCPSQAASLFHENNFKMLMELYLLHQREQDAIISLMLEDRLEMEEMFAVDAAFNHVGASAPAAAD